jgi:hypothetical protein
MTIAPPLPDHGLPITPPPLVANLMELAECVCEYLATEGGGPTCWCGLLPGASAAWEYCGECGGDTCGMGWVRVISGFPYEVFPIPTIDDRCFRPLAWAVEVGSLRCIPQPGDGSPPSPEVMAEAAVIQIVDSWAMYEAIKCCSRMGLGVQSYTPQGPQGGCVGGYWTAYAPMTLLG